MMHLILCKIIDQFGNTSKGINNNSYMKPHLSALLSFVQKIGDNLKQITLYLIGVDNSFELVILLKEEKKKELFCQILNMKNEDKTIDELTISMEPLENILTSLN